MSEKLYACLISPAEAIDLKILGDRFSYQIEKLEDGIVFEIGGLRNLFGDPENIARLIKLSMDELAIQGNIAINESPTTAILQARSFTGTTVKESLGNIPLSKINLSSDTSFIFESLGLRKIADLQKVPENDLLARYGNQIIELLEIINRKDKYILTPNFKEKHVNWDFPLDFPVTNFEQLIFLTRHGLEKIFRQTAFFGLNTEQIAISFELEDKTVKKYQIKVSFPTMEIKFWLKVINLKILNDPPQSGITSLSLTSFFIPSRTIQNSLFAASAPQPESLLLTVLKIRKLVGKENVGVPILLNERLINSFKIDSEKMPLNLVGKGERKENPNIAFSYFNPPLQAEVIIFNRKLVSLKTEKFRGKVIDYGGAWIESAHWWDELGWQTVEWDVELEDGGLYRLVKSQGNWLVLGEYD